MLAVPRKGTVNSGLGNRKGVGPIRVFQDFCSLAALVITEMSVPPVAYIGWKDERPWRGLAANTPNRKLRNEPFNTLQCNVV